MFPIDPSKYRVIDLSMEVRPNESTPDDRPFEMSEGRLGDGTVKFDITRTHTHVGTHVESPWHFYRSGKTITDFPVEKFMGPARLFKGVLPAGRDEIGADDMKRQLEDHRGTFSQLVLRNDSGGKTLRFSMETVPYIRDLGIDVLVFEPCIVFGHGLEDGRAFHDGLMSREICLAEFPANLRALDRDDFYIMGLPMRVRGLDSSMCRLIAIVEK